MVQAHPASGQPGVHQPAAELPQEQAETGGSQQPVRWPWLLPCSTTKGVVAGDAYTSAICKPCMLTRVSSAAPSCGGGVQVGCICSMPITGRHEHAASAHEGKATALGVSEQQ
jgi:hypothetical protein